MHTNLQSEVMNKTEQLGEEEVQKRGPFCSFCTWWYSDVWLFNVISRMTVFTPSWSITVRDSKFNSYVKYPPVFYYCVSETAVQVLARGPSFLVLVHVALRSECGPPCKTWIPSCAWTWWCWNTSSFWRQDSNFTSVISIIIHTYVNIGSYRIWNN
jgi:hypothetical protein